MDITTTTPERRQVARVFYFDPRTAPYINWNSIALTARELGAHFEARSEDNGAMTITMFWSYTEEEAEPVMSAYTKAVQHGTIADSAGLLLGGEEKD